MELAYILNCFKTQFPERHEEVMKALKSCDKNYEKVKLVHSTLQRLKWFPGSKEPSKKCNKKSKELRVKGNSAFSKKTFFEALTLYNEAICHAKDNEDMAIAYANRSACYFELKMYELCCDNISRAKKAGFPQRLLTKLDNRNTEALKILKRIEEEDDEECVDSESDPQLTQRPNPNVPFFANCLQLKVNNDQGRHYVTNQKLLPGQIIATEDPYAIALIKDFYYQRCANCMNENYLNLLPCTSCIYTMFCSKECSDENRVHQYECPISTYTACNDTIALPLRMVLMEMTSFKSIQKWTEFHKNEPKCEFKFSSKLTDEQKLRNVNSLATNQDKRDSENVFAVALVAACIYEQLIKNSKLRNLTDDQRDILMENLMRCYQIYSVNHFQCDSYDSESSEKYMSTKVFARGTYPFCSMFNFACAPNVFHMFHGTQLLLIVQRVIQPGQQLFINFGVENYDYLFEPKVTRQSNLMAQYQFMCKCVACESDYPLPTGLSLGNIQRLTSPEFFHKKTFATLNQLFKVHSELQSRFDHKYPCVELVASDVAWEELIKCMYRMKNMKSIIDRITTGYSISDQIGLEYSYTDPTKKNDQK